MRKGTRWPKVSGSRTRSALNRAAVSTKRVGALAPIGSSRTRALVAGVALAACLLVGAARAAPSDTVSGLSPVTAYVTDGGHLVTPIDLATNTPGTPIPVGDRPVGIAITPDGKTAYVASAFCCVTPISIATNTPGTPIFISGIGMHGPVAVAITPDGKTAYVASSASVTPVDVATNTPGIPIRIDRDPRGIAITPDGKTAYVTTEGTDFGGGPNPFPESPLVTPINLATNTPGTPIALESAEGIAITPDGKTAYIATTNTVTPIDIATNTPGTPIPVGDGPGGIAITPDGKTAYVTNGGDRTVTPITVATNTAGTPIPVGIGPFGIAITPDGKTAYVTNSFGGTVTPITVATNTPGTPILVPGAYSAFGIAITPAPASDNDLALSNLPGNLTVNATSPAGATVSYTAPTVVDEDSPLPLVNCLPASGSLFPIGVTTVSCTATAAGDANSPVAATFTVTVNGTAAQLQGLLASVTGVGPGKSLAEKVTVIEGDVAVNDNSDACDALGGFSNEVRAQTGKKITAAKAGSLFVQAKNIMAVLGC